MQKEKQEVGLSLFAEDIIVYINEPKKFYQKPLQLKNIFVKVAGYKPNIQLPVAFLHTKYKQTGKEDPSQ